MGVSLIYPSETKNHKNGRGEAMRGLKIMLGIVILLLTLLLIKDVLPSRATASAPMQVELVKIGGSNLFGKVLDVRIVE